MVVVVAPEPLVETKSGPHTALIATVLHIAKIASDAHISRTSSCDHTGVAGESRWDSG